MCCLVSRKPHYLQMTLECGEKGMCHRSGEVQTLWAEKDKVGWWGARGAPSRYHPTAPELKWDGWTHSPPDPVPLSVS